MSPKRWTPATGWPLPFFTFLHKQLQQSNQEKMYNTAYVASVIRHTNVKGNAMTNTTTTTIHPFNGLFSRTTWISRYEKGKTNLDLNEARDDGVLGCSGISQTICKQFAPCSRQTTTPTPHHSIFTGQVLFLKSSQQCQSTEGKNGMK